MIKASGYNGISTNVFTPSVSVITGAVQYNGATGLMQVSTGSGWVNIEPNLSISFNDDVTTVLNWARSKMHEEQHLAELAKKFPAVQSALDNVAQAQRDLDAVKTLCSGESK